MEGLGEREWLGDVDVSSWIKLDDPNAERRVEVRKCLLSDNNEKLKLFVY